MTLAPDPGTGPAPEDVMDAYSRIVTAVAADLTPHVAALQVSGSGSAPPQPHVEGAGSAVVFTGDGLLLTNAHVVARASGGTAVFADGTESTVDVVGADPLSDLAVVRAPVAGHGPAVAHGLVAMRLELRPLRFNCSLSRKPPSVLAPKSLSTGGWAMRLSRRTSWIS